MVRKQAGQHMDLPSDHQFALSSSHHQQHHEDEHHDDDVDYEATQPNTSVTGVMGEKKRPLHFQQSSPQQQQQQHLQNPAQYANSYPQQHQLSLNQGSNTVAGAAVSEASRFFWNQIWHRGSSTDFSLSPPPPPLPPSSSCTKRRKQYEYDQQQQQQLPIWINPQDDEQQYNNHSIVSSVPVGGRNTLVFTARKRKADTWSVLLFGLVIVGMLTYWHLSMSLRAILIETETMMAVRNQINIKLRSAEKDVRMLAREVSATETLFEQRREEKANQEAAEIERAVADKQTAQAKLDALRDRVEASNQKSSGLRGGIERYSRDAVVRKYGDHKHMAEVELEFPDEDPSVGPTTFVVELAPIDVMPHAVHVFMEMVDQGLWDGCSFVMNALHVIKAAPLPYDNSPGTKMAKAFLERGLNGPSFKEYTDDYPHEKFTMGFAGGNSPSFYINTDDNTDIHRGDPAFGKIVSGFDTIKRLEDSPTRNGIWFEQRIGIKKISLL